MALKPATAQQPACDRARQVIEIVVTDGYHPDRIEARAGVPLRLIFLRRDDHACSDRVIFSEPRLERHLAPHAVTIVDLPPSRGREIRFTSAMGTYHGRIEFLPPVALNRRRAMLAGVAAVAITASWWLLALVDAPDPVRAAVAVVLAAALLAVLVAHRRRSTRPSRDQQETQCRS
jgi:plastocyanin domain-containing protein